MMALQITNIDRLKNSKIIIEKAKTSFEEEMKILNDATIEIGNNWQGEDSSVIQNKIVDIINKELTNEKGEMMFEMKYLDRIIFVLENAQNEVKKRLNE